MFRTTRSALQFALAAYFGIGVAVALSAPQIFRTLDDPTVAGSVFANVLSATTRVDVVLAVVAAVCAVLCLRVSRKSAARSPLAVVLLLFLLTIGYYRFSIMPRMHMHRQVFLEGGGMVSAEAAAEHRAQFDRLHKRYTRVYSTGILLSLAGFVLVSSLSPREVEA